MSELDEAWDLAMAEARNRAHASGRADIADYLDLRRQNDLLRRTATDWLMAAVTAFAAQANRAGAGIQMQQDQTHRFRRGAATMVGSRITLRLGVRTLTIESGWPRTPRDGIVRGGGLAFANIKHFGRPRLNEELLLIRTGKGSPAWFVLKEDDRTPLSEAHLQRHLEVLLSP